MKVLHIMLIVMLLVAFTAPVFADKGGEPNDEAIWGEAHKSELGKALIEFAKDVTKFLAKELDVDINWGQATKIAKEVLGK